jgi:hypothetical protein
MNWYDKFIKISSRNKIDMESVDVAQRIFSDYSSLREIEKDTITKIIDRSENIYRRDML